MCDVVAEERLEKSGRYVVANGDIELAVAIKPKYDSREPVTITVTVTNHSGHSISVGSIGRLPLCELHVFDVSANEAVPYTTAGKNTVSSQVIERNHLSEGRIKPGASLTWSSEDLRRLFKLSAGSFHASISLGAKRRELPDVRFGLKEMRFEIARDMN
jgi:hypothetical protein